MPFDLKIFRDNDIRGVYPTQLDEGVMYKLAQALVSKYRPRAVSVGVDMRLSGPALSRALIDGFLSMGVKVYDLGMITTPMNFFAPVKLKVGLACAVSASHNPKEYNGLIVAKKNGTPTSTEELREVAELARDQSVIASKRGIVVRRSILEAWVDHVFELAPSKAVRPMTVVFDAGNGVAGIELEMALGRLPQIKAVKMFFEPDGSFPNHIPNPLLSATLTGLSRQVRKVEAVVGFSYDGDADRVIMVDETGRTVEGSVMAAYLAKYLLEHRRYKVRPKMLYTRVMSRIAPQKIKEYGGVPVLAPVGHSLIKAAMRRERAVFAGEHSGHFYFKENGYADSALLASVMLLAAISSDERPLSRQLEEFRVFEKQDEISVKVDDRDRFIVAVAGIVESGRSGLGRAEMIVKDDGVTFDFKDFWFNIRPSGTEPVVRLNVEAYEVGKLKRRVEEILKIVVRMGGHV